MSGLLGVVQIRPRRAIGSIFDSMLAAMWCHDRLRTEACVAHDGLWALGRVYLGFTNCNNQFDDADSVQVLFYGDLQNEIELQKYLAAKGLSNPDRGIVSLIKILYRLHGSSFVSRLQGEFCCLVLDEVAQQLTLATDRLGSYPLYWFKGTERFTFASELKAVRKDPAIKPALNLQAVADYIHFGFLFGEKTLDPQVRLLPPASILTYSWKDNSCTFDLYWHADAAFQNWERGKSEYFDALRETFNCAVERRLTKDRLGLALSGGLDSRAILSAIDCKCISVSTYTLGERGCADEVIARQLSRLAGTNHNSLEMDTAYLSDGLENIRTMVALTDGMYMTHGLTEMLALRFLEQANFSILLRGHGGELAKTSLAWPLHTDARIYEMQSKDEFVSYLLNRVNYISRNLSLRDLFQDELFEQVEGQARRSLETSLAEVQLSPPDLCSYLYLTEHHRRFTVPSLEIFRRAVKIHTPFMDYEFLLLLFQGPACWRDGTDIHKAIIRMNNPKLLKIRNSNTGVSASANSLVEKYFDKVNSLFKYLNVYGYRHYHDYKNWTKKMLLDSVEGVLLHSDTLRRDIYREATLRRLVEETRRGVVDHAYLLQILLIIGVWQQENC